jgi:hypothetical protein
MTYDQYWNDDCQLTKYYRKAHELENSRKNQELWLQGMYIYDALCKVSPVLNAFAKTGTKPLPYPDKPYPITNKEIEESIEQKRKVERQKAKAVFMNWANQLKLPSANKEVKKNGVDD